LLLPQRSQREVRVVALVLSTRLRGLSHTPAARNERCATRITQRARAACSSVRFAKALPKR
jgi:hypothetical protein